MKNKYIPHIFTAAVLSFLLAFGGIGCLATAFKLEISFSILALCCAISALACCTAFSFRKGWLIILGILALLTYYLLRWTPLIDQIILLCYRISRLYDSAYGCGWLGRPTDAETIALPLYCWGGLTALVAGWSTARGRLTDVAVFYSLLPLVLCLVMTDTIPSVICLFILLLGLILLLLTQSVRRHNAAHAVSLTWMLIIPVAVAISVLFAAFPQATYNKQHYADKLGNTLLQSIERLPYLEIDNNGYLQFSPLRHIPDFVDLENKGPNSPFPIPVMEVTAEGSGPLYLRGRDYDQYTGTGWTSTEDRSETFTSLHANTFMAYDIQPQAMGTLTIKTSGGRSSRYLPYYPDMSYILKGGACNNPSSETLYSYSWFVLPEGFESAISAPDNTDWGYLSSTLVPTRLYSESVPYYVISVSTPYDYCLELPDDTRIWAEAYLQANLPELPRMSNICDRANAIARLVRESAAYDLNTPRMPEDSRDFARWFLEESDTGYCVHYATATTVLLRAAGIRARYVEGYLADAKAGKSVTVTEKDAHAWAEYYVEGIGWIPLESTSGYLNSGSSHVPPSAETTLPDETNTDPTVTDETTSASDDTTAASEATTIPSTSTADPTDIPASRPDPDVTGPDSPARPQQPEKNTFTVSKPVIITLGLVLLLIGQYPVRLLLREKWLLTGSPNSRAIKNWRFSCRLAKLSRQTLPAELEELALRARFSQHILAEEDLVPYDDYRAKTVRQLRDCPWWLKLYHRLVWAAY